MKQSIKNKQLTMELSIQRTRLANQRTFLSYTRTGFAIAGIAGMFKKWWISLLGLCFIIGSAIQYVILEEHLKKGKTVTNEMMNMFPVIYVVLAIGALYLQVMKKN